MPIGTCSKNFQVNTVNASQRQQQYSYHHCQLGVTLGHLLPVSVYMLGFSAEYMQLSTTYHIKFISQWYMYVHPHYMTFRFAALLQPVNNVQPTMVIQSRVLWSNIKGFSYTLSHFNTSVTVSLQLNFSFSLGSRMARLVLFLLLLLSGDVELNPGPFGEYFLYILW